jgi:hypothetical protein
LHRVPRRGRPEITLGPDDEEEFGHLGKVITPVVAKVLF